MCRLLISQNLSFRSRLLVKDIPRPPQSLVLSFNFNREHQFYYMFVKTESCTALIFTVVDFHLESTLPQIMQTANGRHLCFTGQSPLRHPKTHYKVWHCVCPMSVSPKPFAHLRFRPLWFEPALTWILHVVSFQFASRLCLLHTCFLELLTLTVLCACPLREAPGRSRIANSTRATLTWSRHVCCQKS